MYTISSGNGPTQGFATTAVRMQRFSHLAVSPRAPAQPPATTPNFVPMSLVSIAPPPPPPTPLHDVTTLSPVRLPSTASHRNARPVDRVRTAFLSEATKKNHGGKANHQNHPYLTTTTTSVYKTFELIHRNPRPADAAAFRRGKAHRSVHIVNPTHAEQRAEGGGVTATRFHAASISAPGAVRQTSRGQDRTGQKHHEATRKNTRKKTRTNARTLYSPTTSKALKTRLEEFAPSQPPPPTPVNSTAF